MIRLHFVASLKFQFSILLLVVVCIKWTERKELKD